ncbi:MAG TPA: zf-HC2 domain-containing protein [Bryobacteraceae bacterium]|jgi:anti-sigma factor RsiW|nr:zf-HC2 domain-containing protein [Bryobacteraceae bacterium]
MSCSPFDLRDYVLKELSDSERKQVEVHIKGCQGCSEEWERLRLTEAALFSLREEEIPQRIAFVSDKIFEPSPWRRGWAAFWGSTARLGFASAAMLSVALVVFAVVRPAAPTPGPLASSANVKAVSVSAAEIQQQIQTAVERAVAASETRQQQKFELAVAEIRQQDLKERQQLARYADAALEMSTRRNLVVERSSYGFPRADKGGLQ